MSNVTCPRCGRLLSTMADFAHRDCPGYTGNGNPLDGIPVPMAPAAAALRATPSARKEAP